MMGSGPTGSSNVNIIPYHPDGQHVAMICAAGVVEGRAKLVDHDITMGNAIWTFFHGQEVRMPTVLAMCIPLAEFKKPEVAKEIDNFMKRYCLLPEVVRVCLEPPGRYGPIHKNYAETQHVIIPIELVCPVDNQGVKESWHLTLLNGRVDQKDPSRDLAGYIRVLSNQPFRDVSTYSAFGTAFLYKKEMSTLQRTAIGKSDDDYAVIECASCALRLCEAFQVKTLDEVVALIGQ